MLSGCPGEFTPPHHRNFCEDIITHAWNGSAWVQATYALNGTNVPFINPAYNPAINGPEYEYTHANEAGCREVAKAFWFLLARIAGWEG